MSRYRKIDQRIWNDQKFRALDDAAKLVFFMLLSHPNLTMLGAMRSTISGLAEELEWSTEDFREAFGQVLRQGMAEHDSKAHLIALPNFLKYNKPESPNVIKAWASALDLLPECGLKVVVVTRCRAFAESLSEGFREALPEAFREEMAKDSSKGMAYQEQEQEQEPSSKEPDGSSSSAKPSAVSKLPNCPHLQIFDLFAKHLSTQPQPRAELWNGKRANDLRDRWKWVLTAKRQNGTRYAISEIEALEWFDGFFAHVAKSDLLSGRRGKWAGCDLGWLVNGENFIKVVEGNFENKETA